MTSRIFTLLCSCLSIGLLASAQVPNYTVGKQAERKQESKTPPPADTSTAIAEVAKLMADNDGFLKNNKKLADYTKAINKSMGFGTATEGDLQYPSIDLYGEQSWHNNAVNPFSGSVKAEVPDSFVVDLSQFVLSLIHICLPKLRAVALIKDKDHLLIIDPQILPAPHQVI